MYVVSVTVMSIEIEVQKYKNKPICEIKYVFLHFD
jgi:hypothetical protein